MEIKAYKIVILLFLAVVYYWSSTDPFRNREFFQSTELSPGQFLKIKLKYVGKTPNLKKWTGSHNYEKKNTDFYNLTFINESIYDLQFVSCRYSLKEGHLRNKNYYSASDLRKSWGIPKIASGIGVTKFNMFTHSKRFKSNILTKQYTLSYATLDGVENEVNFKVPLIFRLKDDLNLKNHYNRRKPFSHNLLPST